MGNVPTKLNRVVHFFIFKERCKFSEEHRNFID
jgi:hypothetical protein